MTIRILKITDPGLCLPLGPAKVKPKPEKVDPIKAFEIGDHKTLEQRATDLFNDWLRTWSSQIT